MNFVSSLVTSYLVCFGAPEDDEPFPLMALLENQDSFNYMVEWLPYKDQWALAKVNKAFFKHLTHDNRFVHLKLLEKLAAETAHVSSRLLYRPDFYHPEGMVCHFLDHLNYFSVHPQFFAKLLTSPLSAHAMAKSLRFLIENNKNLDVYTEKYLRDYISLTKKILKGIKDEKLKKPLNILKYKDEASETILHLLTSCPEEILPHILNIFSLAERTCKEKGNLTLPLLQAKILLPFNPIKAKELLSSTIKKTDLSYKVDHLISAYIEIFKEEPIDLKSLEFSSMQFPKAHCANIFLNADNPIDAFKKKREECLKSVLHSKLIGFDALFYYTIHAGLLEPETLFPLLKDYFQLLEDPKLQRSLEFSDAPILDPAFSKLYENPHTIYRIHRDFGEHFSKKIKAMMIYKAIMASSHHEIKLQASDLIAKALSN